MRTSWIVGEGPGSLERVLDRWRGSWIVGEGPGSLERVLDRWRGSWIVGEGPGSLERVLNSSESTGETWHRCDGPGMAWMDLAWPRWTWCRRDGRGVPGMDVASPGRTWHPRDGRGDVLRGVEGSAASLERRHCLQKVGTVIRGA